MTTSSEALPGSAPVSAPSFGFVWPLFGPLDDQKPNHDVDLGASCGGSGMAVSGWAVCATGVLGRGPSSGFCSSVTGGCGVEVGCVSVNGVLDHHPNHPDDVAGRWGVAFVSGSFGGAGVVALSPAGARGALVPSPVAAGASPALSPSSPAPFLPFSSILDSPDAFLAVLWILLASLSFMSKRLKSGALPGLTLSPTAVSRRIDVDGEAFGVSGHDPYQLCALRT